MAKKKRRIAKKKNKLREFWKYSINPITGWRVVARTNTQTGINVAKKRVVDQASIFKPKGF